MQYSAIKSVIDTYAAVLRGELYPHCFWIALNEWQMGKGYGMWWIYNEEYEDASLEPDGNWIMDALEEGLR
jgi:hypothetical protein